MDDSEDELLIATSCYNIRARYQCVMWARQKGSVAACANNCPSRINKLMRIQKVTIISTNKLGEVDTARQRQLRPPHPAAPSQPQHFP